MINEIIRWIESSLKHLKYGDLVITVKVHDGRVSMIEKSKIERTKPSPSEIGEA